MLESEPVDFVRFASSSAASTKEPEPNLVPSSFDPGQLPGVLSRKEILQAFRDGAIRIEPFNSDAVEPNSVDVRLGEYYYREKAMCARGSHLYNMYDDRALMWESSPRKARTLIDWILTSQDLIETLMRSAEGDTQTLMELVLAWAYAHCKGIRLTESVMSIRPGETILGHTQEFIGAVHGLTTMMKTRSSLGRSNIGICKCAGWGDTGFVNRWTLEITNFSRIYTTILVCGRRVGQIVFMRSGGEDGDGDGEKESTYEGKYQDSGVSFDELVAKWHPSQMLPKLHKDVECPMTPEEQADGIDLNSFKALCEKHDIVLSK